MAQPVAHCHKMIAAVAKEAAGELYEKLMGNDQFYAAWRRQNEGATAKQMESRFIEKNWGKCIGFARATLAAMLRGPLPDHLKEDIVDALSKDATLMRGRNAGRLMTFQDYHKMMH